MGVFFLHLSSCCLHVSLKAAVPLCTAVLHPGFVVPSSFFRQWRFIVGLSLSVLELIFAVVLLFSLGSFSSDEFPIKHDPGESGGVHSQDMACLVETVVDDDSFNAR